VVFMRIQRRSAHFKILCIDCNGVFEAHSLSQDPTNQQIGLEENIFLKNVRNIVSKEVDFVKS
jgi:hypothetical protein